MSIAVIATRSKAIAVTEIAQNKNFVLGRWPETELNNQPTIKIAALQAGPKRTMIPSAPQLRLLAAKTSSVALTKSVVAT